LPGGTPDTRSPFLSTLTNDIIFFIKYLIKEHAGMDEKISKLRDTVKEFLLNIIKRIDDITDEYNNTGALDTDRLEYLFEDLESIAEGINAIKEYYPVMDILEFQEKIELMERAIGEHDMMLLSDIMKFELKGLLEFWEKCLVS
jgi:hypothetical protein